MCQAVGMAISILMPQVVYLNAQQVTLMLVINVNQIQVNKLSL